MSSIWRTLKSALGQDAAPVRSKHRRASASRKPSAPRPPFRACTIEPGPDACAAVTVLQKQRFLQMEAPLLPLPECGRIQCKCRYRWHDDRRSPRDDRRTMSGVLSRIYSRTTEERRHADGRRANDSY
ncbi:MAG: hypothetical protein RJQ10_00555 [Haliea sp.]|uniref:hypothetical protein n=1 Tax=Haliea sp. TaxID=1932666 RepID=UPI0032EACD5E